MTRVCVFLSLVASVTALSQPPIIFSEPAYEVYYTNGESVQLPCSANGEPRPQYRWRRNDIGFNTNGNDTRIVQLPNNGTLVINSTGDTDAGIYQCFASNALGTSASKKIKLIEAKLGELTLVPPTHLSPKIGEPLTLPCRLPESVPQPLVYWSILQETGLIKRYIYDSRVSVDREFRLRFANVRAEDRKGGLRYACFNMNPVLRQGSIWALYYISPTGANDTVAEVKYMWADQDDRFGLLGDTFSMKCIFSGNPTPDVHWERLENKTLPDRANVTSFGQELKITNLQFEDAGGYQCWGTNSVSGHRVIRSFNVRVNARPYFLEEPEDIETGVGDNAEFTCLAEGLPEPDIEWFIDGVALRDVTDPRITGPRFKRPSETKIILENVQLSDHMVIQCNASNVHGYIFANAYLNVVASPRPGAPTEVIREGCNVNATISWRPGRNNAPVDYYVIEYNTYLSPDNWTFGLQVNSTVNSVNFTLSLWVEYTFRVIAYNEIGASKPSNPAPHVCMRRPERPAYHPRNLQTLGNLYNYLYIEWTPVPECDQNGPGFYYILGIKLRSGTLEIPINDWRVSHYEMPVWFPYTPFQITLEAGNAVGKARGNASAIIGYSYESTPSIKPANLVASEVGLSYVILQWDFNRSEIGKAYTEIHGEFRGFMIDLWEQNRKTETFRQYDIGPESQNNATGNIFTARVDNLLPNTNMEVQIHVKNNYYISSPTEVIRFKTFTGFSQPPIIFSEPAYEVYYTNGESVQLPCVANGEPRPQYRWRRNNIDLHTNGNDTRIVQLRNNGTLVINSTGDTAAGVYQCFARNSLGTSASKKIKLIQAKLGEFAYESPIHLSPKIGEPLTLPCPLPESAPRPLVFWINTQGAGDMDPYIYDSRISVDRNFRLRFANVRAEDKRGGLPYACIAMNPVLRRGSIGTQYYISPIEATDTLARVRYMWSDRSNRFGLLGDTFSMKCIFSGNPTPDVYWERLENKTIPDRANVKSFGQELEITNLQPEDEGVYRCWGTNSVNSYPSIRRFYVRVHSRPYFLEQPEDIETGVGANAMFTCIARGLPEPVIEWFFEGVALKDVTDPRITGTRFKRSLQTTIILENVQLGDHMVIQCNASNIHGYIFANAYLHVVATPRPSAPRGVVWEGCNVNATISWRPGRNNAPVNYYVVEYNTSLSPDTWTSGLQVNSTVNRVNFTLSPWVKYTFRVIAYNEIGASKPSNPTPHVCIRRPERPAYHPRDLRTLGNRYGKLCIEWTPVPEYDQHGPGFYYILSILRVGAQAETEMQEMPFNDWRISHYEMSTSYVYTPYRITLRAGNAVGSARADPSVKIGYSYESTPSITPVNLTATEVGHSYVILEWDFDRSEIGKSNTEIHGEFRGFQIDLWERNWKTETFRQYDIGPESQNNATGNIFTARVDNLLPNTNMEAQIHVKNNYYISSPGEIVQLKTLTGSPSITPVNLTATEVGHSYVILQWDFDRSEIGKADTDIHGEFRGFQIDIWERNRKTETLRQYDIGPESQNNATGNIFTARVDNLLPNTNMQAQIRAKNNHYISSPTEIVRFKTLSGCPN